MSVKSINYLRSLEILLIASLTGLSLDAKLASVAQQSPPAADPEQLEELEINVYGDRLLSKPIYSPFRREGTLKDSTRPAYVIDQNEIKA
jgi:vitamin B12 transporter